MRLLLARFAIGTPGDEEILRLPFSGAEFVKARIRSNFGANEFMTTIFAGLIGLTVFLFGASPIWIPALMIFMVILVWYSRTTSETRQLLRVAKTVYPISIMQFYDLDKNDKFVHLAGPLYFVVLAGAFGLYLDQYLAIVVGLLLSLGLIPLGRWNMAQVARALDEPGDPFFTPVRQHRYAVLAFGISNLIILAVIMILLPTAPFLLLLTGPFTIIIVVIGGLIFISNTAGGFMRNPLAKNRRKAEKKWQKTEAERVAKAELKFEVHPALT